MYLRKSITFHADGTIFIFFEGLSPTGVHYFCCCFISTQLQSTDKISYILFKRSKYFSEISILIAFDHSIASILCTSFCIASSWVQIWYTFSYEMPTISAMPSSSYLSGLATPCMTLFNDIWNCRSFWAPITGIVFNACRTTFKLETMFTYKGPITYPNKCPLTWVPIVWRTTSSYIFTIIL